MHTATAVRRVALLWVLAALPCLGEDPGSVLNRVDEHYNRLKTLRARYVEHYAGMGLDRTESGTLEMAKPGRMRWDYDKPAGKLFVMDGKFGWSYTPGDGQVQRIPAKKMEDLRSPLRFLLGHTHLAKGLEAVSVSRRGGGYEISGVPRGLGQRFAKLVLIVDAEAAIETISVEEIDGATTSFVFSAMSENIPLPSTDFVFVPPAGVSIVEGLPPV